MSLIDRKFLKQLIAEGNLQVKIKKTAPIKVRGLGSKEYDACEYAIILMYIPSKDSRKVALIRREIYIVDDLSAKTLININIIKLERIILNTNKDLAIISSCQLLEVPISIITKGPRTNTVVVSKARYTIPAYFFIIISIEHIELLADYKLIFESKRLDALTLSTYLINYNLARIVVYNNINLSITLLRYTRLSKVLKYKAKGYF